MGQMNGTAAAAAVTIEISTFHESPARKITKKPEANTRSAVPRSGWRAMRPTGTASITPASAKSRSRRPSSWRWKYHASTIGTAIFMISEGCSVVKPRFNQRRAPLRTSPKSATPTSSPRPATYTGSARRISVCGCTWAKSHRAKSARARLRAWLNTRSGDPPPEAEYTTVSPSATVSAIAAISGPSMRRARKSKARLIMFLFLDGAGLGRGRRRLDHRLPAGEVVVEHGARDRARRRAAVLAVLHQDRERDLRVVGGREGDEQRVVPVLALQALHVVALALLHADHLRGSGLRRDRVGRAGTGLRGGSARLGDVRHGRADDGEVLRAHDGLPLARRRLVGMVLVRLRVLDRLQQVRMHRDAAVRERRGGRGELHRRGEHVALADADAHRVARVPLLPETLHLPRLRRREPGKLALDVDAGLLAEAEAREEIVDRVDAELVGEPVEVGVARDDDRAVHVHQAVAALLPVAVAVRDAGERVVARIRD